MTDIDFMCAMCRIDDILAQMTEEEKVGLILLFIRDMKKTKGDEPKGGGVINMRPTDYFVTWDDVKNRAEKFLKEKRRINGDTLIPMGLIFNAMDKVWIDIFNELREKYETDGEKH